MQRRVGVLMGGPSAEREVSLETGRNVLRGLQQRGHDAVGLDWIPLDHVRFKLNYAMSDADRTGPATVDEEAQVVTLRTQFDF